jgi:hypothetical protein
VLGGALGKHHLAPGVESKLAPVTLRVFPYLQANCQPTRAMSFCATGKVCLMKVEKKIIELEDCIVTVSVRPKKPPKAHNDNLPYDFWTDELKEFLDRYDK